MVFQQDFLLCFNLGIPRDVDFNVVRDLFLSIDGIVAVHNLRIWGLTTDKTALSAHIAISKITIFPYYSLFDFDVQFRGHFMLCWLP